MLEGRNIVVRAIPLEDILAGGPVAAQNPAQADEASLWLVVFLAVLLAVSLAAVIMSPPQPSGRQHPARADEYPRRGSELV